MRQFGLMRKPEAPFFNSKQILMLRKKSATGAVLFLGGGRITSALCAGLRLAGYRREIVVFDRNPEKLCRLKKESQIDIAGDLKSAVERAGTVIVAVPPACVPDLLDQVADAGVPPGLSVSLAAGIPLTSLRKSTGSLARWVRAMPSPVCRVARGLTALSFDRQVSRDERARVRQFFELVGQVIEVPEKHFDAFTATYSSSHGYHALATLALAAQRAGLDRKTALTAAAHALADGIQYWRETGLNIQDLLQEAVTPGGIAAASIAAMEKAGYRGAVEDGISAGIVQAQRNAKAIAASSLAQHSKNRKHK
jgi:pyrroline-5-carboxylate reductase